MPRHCLYAGPMNETLVVPRHLAWPGARGGSGALRRLRAVPLLGVLVAGVLLFAPALANADTGSTLTVVGTSDVSDSGLIQNLIQPEFEKVQYPQFTFKYVGTATGTAIKMRRPARWARAC